MRFAELNGFTRATRTSPWHRARLLNEDEAADAYALVITLRSSLLSLREAMNAMNADLHLRRARTIDRLGCAACYSDSHSGNSQALPG